jgi:SAM-dependent methyltransferase
MHFERMAAEYATSRPPYPPDLYRVLLSEGVVGPGTRVLEVGAGSGLATRELVRLGSEVVAVEPGRDLTNLLEIEVPQASVVVARLEDAVLLDGSFDSVVAATSMHWIDLATGLPKLHAALRARGWLAVWRHQFGDDSVDTEFRSRIKDIVGARAVDHLVDRRANASTMEELSTGGWFEPVRTQQWRWSIELDSDRVRRLFRTFSDWTDAEVEVAARAADELGGVVTEHYRTVMHLLRKSRHHEHDG